MFLGLAFVTAAGEAADWPAFRGPDGDGRSSETEVFPSSGALSLEVRWRRHLGSGYSAIAVAGSRVFTLYSDGTTDHLIALDAKSGVTLWQLPLGPTYVGHDGSHSGPLATPAVTGDLVHALGPRGHLITARAESGEVVWQQHLTHEHSVRKPYYGFSASPRLFGNVLVLPLGGPDRAVAGFDAQTGALKWSAGSDAVTYQSPIAWTSGDDRQAVVATNTFVFGIEPRQGAVIWSYPHDGFGTRGAYSLSPVAAGPGRLLLTHRDDASALIQIDPAGTTEKVWEARSIRNSYALPIYHDGDFYAYSNRFLTCVDGGTGEHRWRSRAPGDGFPILVDGHLLIQTKQGSLHLARATPTGYDERAALPLFSGHSWTTPSFAAGAIYARSMGEIARVDPRLGPAASSSQVAKAVASPLLDALEERLRQAADPGRVIDAFLEEQPSFPIVENDTAHFVYRGEAGDVALAGDLPGARREWPMQRLAGTDLFVRSVRLEPDAAVSYLFLVDFEPSPDPLNRHPVRSTVYGPELEPVYGGDLPMSWFAMPGWQTLETHRPPPDRRGTLDQVMMTSQVLDRQIPLTVYRPHTQGKGRRRLPVAYIFGGRGALDQGELPAALDRLIGDVAGPFLAVFILTDGFGALSDFADMFAGELVPFIDSAYRTRATPASRAAVGMGWEALTAAYSTLRRPGVAGKLALLSSYSLTAPEGGPAAWLKSPAEQSLDAYVDWGKYDLRNSHEAWSTADDARRIFDRMRELGYAPAGGEINSGTGWASWRHRTDRWLAALFPLSR